MRADAVTVAREPVLAAPK